MKMTISIVKHFLTIVAMALLGSYVLLDAGDTAETVNEQKLIAIAQRHIEQAWKKNQDQGTIQRVSCTFTLDEICIKTDFSDYRKKRDRYTLPNYLALSSPITEVTYNRCNKQALLIVNKRNSTRRLHEKYVPIPEGSFLSKI
ncbi:MAG: hypothetical protein WC365_03360 [Candidatus Babeliales bacterium]|jgi:hypothetical protein